MGRILPNVDAEMSAEQMPFDCEHIVDSGLGWLISMEKCYGEASEEHDLPLVRSRRRGRGAVLRQDLSRLVRRRGAPRTGRLSVGEERGRLDGRVYRDRRSVPRAQRRTCI